VTEPYRSLQLQITWKPHLEGFRVDSDGNTQGDNLLLPFPRTPNVLFGRLRIERQALELGDDEILKRMVGHETAALMYDLAYELRKPDFEAHTAAILARAAMYAHEELLRP
jgi:hypothetical protein